MQILDHLISTLNLDAPVRDIRLGVFHSAVLTRRCGLAATLTRDALRQSPAKLQAPGDYLDWPAEALVKLACSSRLLEAVIGMATLNSLLEFDPDTCLEVNASELIFEKGRDRNVVIVGHFPFIPAVREIARNTWVLEENPRPGDLPAEEAADVIPQADVVAVTGTALTNHTLPDLLPLCRPDAFVILLGDTAPLSPVLFDYGISAVAGTYATDPETVLRHVSQGATYRQIRGIRRLTLVKA